MFVPKILVLKKRYDFNRGDANDIETGSTFWVVFEWAMPMNDHNAKTTNSHE